MTELDPSPAHRLTRHLQERLFAPHQALMNVYISFQTSQVQVQLDDLPGPELVHNRLLLDDLQPSCFTSRSAPPSRNILRIFQFFLGTDQPGLEEVEVDLFDILV